MYNKVFHVYFGFVVYCFYSVEKMDNFHFGLVKFGDSHENLLKLLLVVENFVFLKKKTISSMWISNQVGIQMIIDSAPESIKKSISRSGD